MKFNEFREELIALLRKYDARLEFNLSGGDTTSVYIGGKPRIILYRGTSFGAKDIGIHYVIREKSKQIRKFRGSKLIEAHTITDEARFNFIASALKKSNVMYVEVSL